MRSLLLVSFCLFLQTSSLFGQGSAIRFIIVDLENTFQGEYQGFSGYYGMGFDHDVTSRSSIGVECSFLTNDALTGTTVRLRSAYHFSRVDYGSMYVATTAGYRSLMIGSVRVSDVPIGFRFGYRGTLVG